MGFFKKIYERGKGVIRRTETKGKKAVRSVAKPLARAAPAAAAALTGALNFIPGIGWAIAPLAGALATNNARYLGAMAARGEGLKGREAREEGRDLRKKVGIAAAAGSVLGFLANQVVIPAVQSSAAASAAGGAALSAGKAATTLPGGLTASQLLAATSGVAPAAQVAAAAGGGGLLSTVTSVLGAVAPLGALLKPAAPGAPTSDGFLGDILGGLLGAAGGGSPGSAPVEPESNSEAFKTGAEIPTVVKVVGGLAAAGGVGFLIYKMAKKAA